MEFSKAISPCEVTCEGCESKPRRDANSPTSISLLGRMLVHKQQMIKITP